MCIMKVTIIQLINSFYKDGNEVASEDVEQQNKEPLGEFCVLGYFDAMKVTEKEIEPDKENMLEKASDCFLDNLKGRSNYRTLICIPVLENTNPNFWEDVNTPFYFVSMVRVKTNGFGELKEKIRKSYSADEKSINYYSYDHSDVISVYKTNRYTDGIKHIEKLQQEIEAYKVYTIMAVRESVLERPEIIKKHIVDEMIDCRLHVVMKDLIKARQYCNKIKRLLAFNNADVSFAQYNTLGSGDILLEIDNISFGSLLAFYKTGEILTHNHPDYLGSVFNIETRIVEHKEREQYGKLDMGQFREDKEDT